MFFIVGLLVLMSLILQAQGQGFFSDVEVPLPSKQASTFTNVAFIENMNQDESSAWVNNMVKMNETEIQSMLTTMGAKSLNYTVWKLDSDVVVGGQKLNYAESLKRDSYNVKDNFLLVRANDESTRSWFSNFRIMRPSFNQNVQANFLLTWGGFAAFAWGGYSQQFALASLGMAGMLGAAILTANPATTSNAATLVQSIAGNLQGPEEMSSPAKRALLSESLRRHLPEDVGDEELDRWLHLYSLEDHDHFMRRGEDGHHVQLILFSEESHGLKEARQEAKRQQMLNVYGLQFEYYMPSHDPALSSAYEKGGYNIGYGYGLVG